MENQSSVPPTDSQHRQIPPTAGRSGLTFQPNMPVHQQSQEPSNNNRFCPRCSEPQRTQVRPAPEYPEEQQRPRPLGVSNTANPNQYQNVNNRRETATIVPHREHAMETAITQDNFGYAPVHERASTPSEWSTQTPARDTSIAERRRRLVGRYIDDPDVYVSTIRLEPGPSGELQVIITLEMADIL